MLLLFAVLLCLVWSLSGHVFDTNGVPCGSYDIQSIVRVIGDGEYREAIHRANCILADPELTSVEKRADALHMLGLSYFEIGDEESALEALRACIDIYPDNTYFSNAEAIETQHLLRQLITGGINATDVLAQPPSKQSFMVDGYGRRSDVRALAIYFPQFHPDKHNSHLWGAGFTEWIHVAKARPLFDGHYQPHIPADLGFYDLRVPETRALQAAIARAVGIQGFIYYHFWFNGQRILNLPLDELLRTKQPDFPFALCWANSEWRAKWTATTGEVDNGQFLYGNNYEEEDNVRHIRWLLKEVFPDPRYIRVGGKPLFGFHDANITRGLLDTWRREAAKEGVELYLCLVMHHRSRIPTGDFDCIWEWGSDVHGARQMRKNQLAGGEDVHNKAFSYSTGVVDYDNYAALQMLNRLRPPMPARASMDRIPVVTPRWDNSPRYPSLKKAFVMDKQTPDSYEKFLRYEVDHITPASNPGKILVINAWNEWGEGNHLEPDQKWGWTYLDGTRHVLRPQGPPILDIQCELTEFCIDPTSTERLANTKH
eukprot:Rmarinus@m.24035